MNEVDFFDITVEPANWQQHSEQLSGIRFAVFVDEQQVPVEIELDDQDSSAQHWLAYEPAGTAVGTARLEANGKIGRMAVLSDYRGRGVGGALMRRIILDASALGMMQLSLHAQSHALEFYQQFGFVSSGDEFEEAGIAHRNMVLDLGPYRHRATKLSSQLTHLQNPADIIAAIARLAGDNRRRIRIYSEQLDIELFAENGLIDVLRDFARRHKECRVEIVVRNIDGATNHYLPLLELQQRLSSHIEIRQCDPREQTPDADFIMLFDSDQIIQSSNKPGNNATAQLLESAAAQARQLNRQFDELWQYAEIPMEICRLNLSG